MDKIKAKTGHGTLEATVRHWRAGIRDENRTLRLSELALHAMALTEAIVSEEEDRTRTSGTSISCRKGCGACCRQVIPLSPPEAFLMAEMLAGPRPVGDPPWALRIPERVRERFRNALERLDERGLGDAPLLDQAARYFMLGMPCPFLEEESCSIHADRPLVCREHLILSDSAFCADFGSPFIRPLSLPVSIQEALGAVAGEVLGSAPEMIPMVRLQAWVEANREAGEREWEAGFLLDKLEQRVRDRS